MITPLKEKHIRKTWKALCGDRVILSAAHAMPHNMVVELLGNKKEFLRGLLAGLGKSLVLLERIASLLQEGKTLEALQLKAGLGAAMLLICQKLLDEPELPELPLIDVPEKKLIVPP